MKVCPKCDHLNPETHEICEECGAAVPMDGPDPLIGQVLAGRYKIEKLIGQGAMGQVYRALQQPIDRLVAVKVLHPHLMEDRRVSKRFQREAQAASRFNHPNSIGIIDFGETENGSLYIAMEYITGEDLAETISKQAPLAPERAVNIATQVLNALHLAHANKIIHRDLKPENIMLAELSGYQDFVKVCDFGIAKIQQTEQHNNGESALTMFGMICGTPYYMSPEQAKGEELDGRTDLYSMGVILYEMLTGEVPFRGTTPVEVIARHLTDPPTPISEAYPNLKIPRALEKVVMESLSKSRADRYDDAKKMSEALENALKEAEFQNDLQRLVQDAESSPPVVVGSLSAPPPTPSPNTRPSFPSAPGSPVPSPPVPAHAAAGGFSTPYSPASPSAGPGTMVEEAPSTSRAVPGLVQESVRQTFDNVAHTPLPHQAVRRSKSKAANTSYAGAPIQEDFSRDIEDDLALSPSSGKGKIFVFLVLFLMLGAAGYYYFVHLPSSNMDLPKARHTVRKRPWLRRPVKRRPLKAKVAPSPNQQNDDDDDPDDNPPPTRVAVVRHTKPRRQRPRPRRRILRVAYISPSTQYRKRRRGFSRWMRRFKFRSSDLPPNVARTWRRAEQAARRKKFGQAQTELRKTLRHWRSLRKLPIGMIKRKFSRVKRLYLKSKNNLSKTTNQKVLKALINSQQAIFGGSSRKANRYLNQALRLL